MISKKIVKYVSSVMLSAVMALSAVQPVLAADTLPKDTEAPTAPTEFVSIDKKATSVSFTWNPSTDNRGVTEYDLFSGTSLVARAYPGSGNIQCKYTLNGLASNTTYKFTVKAKDKEGNVSAASNVMTVTTNPLVAPTDLAYSELKDTNVVVSWTPAEANGGTTRYNIYKGTTLVGSTDGETSFKVTGLIANTNYKFTVRAKDVAGKLSPASRELWVTTRYTDTQAPTAPTNLVYTEKTDTTISLNWGASTDNVKVTEYNIYDGKLYVGRTSSTYFTAMNLQPSSTHRFTVKAKDAAGNVSKPSNTLVVTTNPPDTQAPTTPTGLTVTSKTDTTVSLKWTPSTDNVGVVGYEVYCGAVYVGQSGGASCNVTRLIPNTNYKFVVKAKDAAGNISKASKEVSVTTNPPDTQAPTAPTDLKVQSKTDTRITITWTASTDNVAVNEYDVYVDSIYVGSTYDTYYTIYNLTPSTTYTITVKAKDAMKNVSKSSKGLAVTTDGPDTQAPTAPTNLKVIDRTDSTITIQWDPSTDNKGVVRYNIYLGTELVGTTSDNYYTITGLSASTKYSFTIRAVDKAGNLSAPATIK
ncbi:MAG: fibronectin type III domain-containing protein [Clostridiaceae bacterium]